MQFSNVEVVRTRVQFCEEGALVVCAFFARCQGVVFFLGGKKEGFGAPAHCTQRVLFYQRVIASECAKSVVKKRKKQEH